MDKSNPLVEYPLGRADPRCLLFRHFLSASESAELLQLAESHGFVSAQSNYPPSYRNNLRLVFDDPQLAKALLRRVREVLPHGDADWQLDAINPRWRSCRYEPGQAFNIHQDGVLHAADGRVSRWTFMLYLNDADQFSGGDTVFYDGPPDKVRPPREIARVRPSAGALIVFDHRLWHAGAQVHSGSKTILRSDLLYRSKLPRADVGHRGYVFCLAAADAQRCLSGGRDGTIRLNAPGQAPQLMTTHRQSVLGLYCSDSGRLASVSRDSVLQIHALDGSAPPIVVTDAHRGAVLCVIGTAERLFTGGADHRIAIWDWRGNPLATLQGHRGWVWDLAVLDERRLCSVGEDGQVLLWGAGQLCEALVLDQPIRAVVWLPQRRQLMVGDSAGQLHLLALAEGQLRHLRAVDAHRAQITRLRLCPDGGVLSCAEDGQVRRWQPDLDHCELLAQRDGFATDALQLGDGVVSAGYQGGVIWHCDQ